MRYERQQRDACIISQKRLDRVRREVYRAAPELGATGAIGGRVGERLSRVASFRQSAQTGH